MKTTLPFDSEARKQVPIFSGFLAYFPAAIAGVASHSKTGNDKHNPGQPLHHARGKSTDHADCILRHLMDIGDLEAFHERTDLEGEPAEYFEKKILEEANALAWRALALAQRIHEQYAGAPLAPAARLPAPPAPPPPPPETCDIPVFLRPKRQL